MAVQIISGIHRGHLVMHAPQYGITVREKLRKHARRLERKGVHIGGVETHQALRDMERLEIGAVEIAGLWSKLKKGVKKGVSKTVKAAKVVAKNKITKSLYSAVKTAAPSPYKEVIAAGEVAARVGTDLAKGLKKAKKTVAISKKLATGKTSLAAAKKAAKKAGLKPSVVRDVAATMKIATSSNPDAQRAIAAVREIEQAAAEAAPKSYQITGPSGRKYQVSVSPA